MRRIVIYLIAAALALPFAASCTKEIQFKGDETASKLVLYSLAVPGQELSADLSSSVFFLKRNYDNKLFTSSLDTLRGTVKVYVNGAQQPYLMRYSPYVPDDEYGYFYFAPSTLRYVSDYVPSEGDRIRIVADFPGFDSVEGETVVPVSGRFSVNSIKVNRSEEGEMNIEVSARVTDDGSGLKYYDVSPIRFFSWDGGETYEQEQVFDITSNDVIFRNTTSDLMSILDEGEQTSSYFSDELFRGGSYDFKFSFRAWEPLYDEYYGYGDPNYSGEKISYLYTVRFTTLTTSLYNHILSMRNLSYSDFGFFGESSTLYSNVKGGYGCVCSSVSLSLPLNIQ